MPVKVRCGRCGKEYAAPDSLAGKSVRCRQCGNIVPVPAAEILEVKAPPPGSPVIDPTPPPALRPAPPLNETPAQPPATRAQPAQESPPHDLAQKPSPAQAAPAGKPAAPAPTAAQARWQQLADAPPPKDARPPRSVEQTEIDEDDLQDDDEEAADVRPPASLEHTLAFNSNLPANGLFDFPGSNTVDQLVPWVILVGGAAWVLHDSVRSSPGDHPGLGYLRAFVYLLTYAIIVFPITWMATRAAVRVKRFGLPPAGAARVFAAYFPPVVFGTVLWLVDGSTAALITGLFVGLIPGLGSAWLLLRLQPYQGARVLTSATGGFLAGTLLAVMLLLGVNWCLVAGYRGTEHTHQESPLGPGFRWEAPPEKPRPPKPEVELAPVTPATVPATHESITEPATAPASQPTTKSSDGFMDWLRRRINE